MASEISCLRLEPADNGFKVMWNECMRNENQGTYGNSSYKNHEILFKDNESKQAMSKFMEMRNKMNGIEGEDEE